MTITYYCIGLAIDNLQVNYHTITLDICVGFVLNVELLTISNAQATVTLLSQYYAESI